MRETSEQHSEVARLINQISQEYEAAHQGLSGLSQGTARHDFITARMERMEHLHSQLAELVGPDTATAIVVQALDQAPP